MLFLLASSLLPAHAYETLGRIWTVPVALEVTEVPLEGVDGWLQAEVDAAVALWTVGTCAPDLTVTLATTPDNIGYNADTRNLVTIEDPEDQIAELGTPAVTLVFPGAPGAILPDGGSADGIAE